MLDTCSTQLNAIHGCFFIVVNFCHPPSSHDLRSSRENRHRTRTSPLQILPLALLPLTIFFHSGVSSASLSVAVAVENDVALAASSLFALSAVASTRRQLDRRKS